MTKDKCLETEECSVEDSIEEDVEFELEENNKFGLNIFGEIEETSCADIVESLYSIYSVIKENEPMETPLVEIILSTNGGSLYDAFGIVDCIELLKTVATVKIIAVGKVMSAGLLILSAGSERETMKNCRFMIHPLVMISEALVADYDIIKNEADETRFLEKTYIDILEENTSLNEAKLKRLLKKRKNVYFNATEAKKWGLVDTIL